MANEQAIRNRRGTLLTTIKAGRINTTATSLVLQGYGVTEYGQLRDQNLVHFLENFYNTVGPDNPIEGQLWFNPNDQLYVWSVGAWEPVVPPADELGFEVIAGDGLTGGGFPTTSPAEVVLNVGAGSGIRVGSPTGFITVKEAEIDHDTLSGYVANEHIDHTSIILTAGTGMILGSPSGDVTGELTQSQEFIIRESSGIRVDPNSVRTNYTVFYAGGSPDTQTIGGDKLWFNQLKGEGTESDPSVAVAFTFTSDTDTGMLRAGSNRLAFATGGVTQFEVRNTGVLRAIGSGSPLYENKISADDDIPNKAYVDSLAGTGVSPTETTFVGTSTITGLDTTKKYLVHVYGVVPSKGNTNFTLDAIRLRTGTTLGAGSLLDQTSTVAINWMDGNAPTQASFFADMDGTGATSINCQINDSSTGGGDIYSIYMTAVQLN